MPIEVKKDPFVIVSTTVLALAILGLVAGKFIDWKMAIAGLGLLFAPSIAGARRDPAERTRSGDDDQHPPAAGGSGLPLLITPISEPPVLPAETPRRTLLPALLCALALTASACTPGERQTARDALSVLQVACAIAHAESDDQTIGQICGISDALIPDVRAILAEQRKAIASARRAGGCRDSDAGTR